MGMAARHADGQTPPPASLSGDELGPVLLRALAAGVPQVSLLDPVARVALAEAPARVKVEPPRKPAPTTAAEPRPQAAKGGQALELALSGVWAGVLGYESIKPDDDFYALGGDSISGMQIVEQLVRDLGHPATLADLFESRTVAALAKRLRDRMNERHKDRRGIPPAPARDRYPVAWEQLAVLRAEEASQMGTAYNLPGGLRLPEDVDVARLRSALASLAERHEILRTRFARPDGDGGEPTMEVLASQQWTLEELDVPGGQDLVEALTAFVRPFDLWNGELIRFALARVDGVPRVLFFDIHHALADAFSAEVVLADLAALYAGTPGPMPTTQLKDYAWWSREGDGAAVPEDARAYWLKRFAGPIPVLDLPADRPRPARHTWSAETIECSLAPETVSRLRAFAAERRTTSFVVVTAAWSLLLARYARTDDLVIAVPVDSRETAGMAGVVGMLVSLLPLRLSVPADARVADLIDRTHTAHAEALRHRAFGLGRLLAEIAPPAAPERALLSDVALSYMNFAESGGGTRAANGLTPINFMRRDGKGDLSIFVRDLPGQMSMAIEYYTAIFDRNRIERMGRHVRTLLAALVNAAPDTLVASLPLVDAAEAAWLDTVGRGAEIPKSIVGRGLFEVFTDQAKATPDAIALEGAGVRLTFAALRERACAVAERLRAAGVSPGDHVALHVERDANASILILGAVAVGAVYVPLDPAWPADRVAWVVQDAGCAVAIADAAGRKLIPPGSRVLDSESLAMAGPAPDANPPSAGTAYVMYTSGSTGTPKGVIVPQVGVVRMAYAGGKFTVRPDDRVMQAAPLSFDASTMEIWTAWLNGARLCVASREEVLDPAALAAAIRRYGATVMWLTTGLFNRQVDAEPASFASMRQVWTGGDVASAAHIERAMHACPGVEFVNGYGPTENTGATTIHAVVAADVAPGPVPIGHPVAETWVAVLEPGGALAPIGIWGELVTGGLGLADGYLGRPDLTAERFVTDTFDPSRRFYRTGDLARWRADGVLEFGGRRDTQVKLRGFRIELEEIEHALNTHPAVAASAVLFVRRGETDGRLVACLQPTSDAPPPAALREWLSRRIPDYMVPRRFVVVPVLPVNANGKVDRSKLAAMLPTLENNLDTSANPPIGDSERLVANVFGEVFGVVVNDRNASFLDLGGHSLLAIKVVNRIAQASGVRLSMREFFVSPTVSGLAALIVESGGAGDAISRTPDAPTYPASHAQTRLYLASRMEAADGATGAAYNMGMAFPSAGALDIDALREAARQLTVRHETLRTGFEELDGEIVQRVAAVAIPTVEVEDVSAAADPRAEALRFLRRESAIPFDLAAPPLMRVRAVRLASPDAPSGEAWLVFILLHHIVGDGWSAQILLREFGSCYQAATRGEQAPLPALPIAYRDFAAWQNRRDWTDSAAFWRKELAGAPHQVALPSERPTLAVQSHRGETVRRELPDALSMRLTAYARRHGASPAAVGLALFAGLLYRLTRQSDMLVGIGVAGRDRAEVEGIIGFFVNILPVRIRVSDETDFSSLVDQVHATMMTAMDHRDYPFDLLVRTMAPRRVGNRQPLVNVVYEYQRFEDLNAGARTDPSVDSQVEDAFLSERPAEGSFGLAVNEAIRTPTAKHDLLLFHVERRTGSELVLEYDTDILDQATATRWLGYLEQFATMALGHQDEGPTE